jgi:UDP-GlcNAc:undecaprenyl-phosphate GlcNAc-1-phosphate transferase
MQVLGAADDLRPMKARVKLLGQVVVSAAVCWSGFRVTEISAPVLGHVALPAWAAGVVTTFWLVTLTNAFNLIDGVDGLVVELLAIAAAALVIGHGDVAVVALLLVGAAAGILVYNVAPASIFLGDSGSLMLGFVLAGMALLACDQPGRGVNLAVPLLLLGLPVLDTTIAVARRFLRGQPIFLPDRGHIHHRLLNLKYSPRETSLRLWAISAVSCIAGIMLLTRPEFSLVVYTVLLACGVLFVQQLKIHEFEEVAGSVVRGRRRNIGRSVRVREAAARLSDATSVDGVFSAMGDALHDGEIQRAELTLTPSFMHRGAARTAEQGQPAERVVWAHGLDAPSHSACEVSFPLLGKNGERIGSLTIWQHNNLRERSVAQWRAIACFLCPATQVRLEELWHTSLRPRTAAHRDSLAPTRRVIRQNVAQ